MFLQQAQREIIKLREGEEKQRRAREAREKAEAEKAARAARKRALVDMNAHETQEGVMDSLMEALQTGSAFSRPDQRRKRQTRAAGGKLYWTAYPSTISMKKENARRRKLHVAKLMYESKEAERLAASKGEENEVARSESVVTGSLAALTTDPDFPRYKTPEDNQDLYKQLLLDQAAKTPRPERRFSRVSSFKRKKQNDIACKKIRSDRTSIEETPKRDVTQALGLRRDFEEDVFSSNDSFRYLMQGSRVCYDENRRVVVASYKSVMEELKRQASSNSLRSPSLYKQILIGEALKLTPVKQRRVIVSKKRKRNSLVRRTVRTRRQKHSKSKPARAARKSFGYLGSPPSASVSLIVPPIEDASLPRASDTALHKITRSVDDIAIKIGKTISSPFRLARARNFDDVARWRDENQNDVSTRRPKSNFSSPRRFFRDRKSNIFQQHESTINAFEEFRGSFINVSDATATTTPKTTTVSPSELKRDDTLMATGNSGQIVLKKRHRRKIWRFW